MNESPQKRPTGSYENEIDLSVLLRILWAGKWLIGGITFATAVVAIIVSLMLPNIYRAEALLAPNSQDRTGGLSALAAQYGGLASLAGINIGSGSTDKMALGLEILKSRIFIIDFVERHNLLVPLLAARGWDSESGELEIDSSVFNAATGEWVEDDMLAENSVPSPQRAYKAFSEKLSVSQDVKTGFIKVAFEHYSPVIAKQCVDLLVADLNASIMNQDVSEAEEAIEYLNKQIAKTSLAELHNVFFRLIEEQTKTVMLAKVSKEYLFKTIDPAVVPERKSKPRRSLIVLFSGLFSLVFSMFLVVFRGQAR